MDYSFGNRAKKLSCLLVIAAAVAISLYTGLAGCRKPHTGMNPLAPHRVGPIRDLTGIRVGDTISLNWTTPLIEKAAANGSLNFPVCRLEGEASECIQAGPPLLLPVGVTGTFAEALPASMAAGNPRLAYYSVEVLDAQGTPTGLANRVPVLIGAPPGPVEDLTAEMTEKGVVLRWTPESAGPGTGLTTIRLRRTEGVDPVATQAMRDGLVPFPKRPEVELTAKDEFATTIDPQVRQTEIYQYRAQRVFRMTVEGQTFEMDGQFSPEVKVNSADKSE